MIQLTLYNSNIHEELESVRVTEFRVIESQMLGWVVLGADEIVRVKGRFEL